MNRMLLAAAALCAFALPAAAQSSYGDNSPYADNSRPDYRDGHDQGYRDAMRRSYDGAIATEDVEVAYGPPIDPYGVTTAQRHPLHGTNNFSMDGTSKVGGWTEIGPHTTRGQALGSAAGGSTGGVYSTGP
ncbi:MAG: hypothetical protein J0G99_00225 [Alphaproteobacteria bacterium]|nr:hypothetical protein [Alphaproteobacteria bacterium]